MSASNSRVRDAIRRIALSDPDIRALLNDYKNRGGIASDSIEIEGAADDRAICCDGSTSGGTPGSSTSIGACRGESKTKASLLAA